MIGSSWARNTQHLRVAIVDHDGDHADALERALRLAGHESHRFLGGEPLLRALHPIHGFDAFVLEWELPDISGPNLIRAIHERPSWRAPVLFTSAREQEEVVAYALRLGADGYLVWPIRAAEFVARLEAIVRRGNGRGDRKSEHLDNYLLRFRRAPPVPP